MSKGIIYIMTSVLPGLIKIGKTGSDSFETRMYQLEQNGYRNITGLKRAFAIEVDEYDEKEKLLHTIFEKSQVADTEMFSLNIDIATQLLSSFDGTVIYPKNESKKEIFNDAVDNNKSRRIPDGEYFLQKMKTSDGKEVKATAVIRDGAWTLKQGSILGMKEDVGVSGKAKVIRATLLLDANGVLLEDAELGMCTPSLVGVLVVNGAVNGWLDWKNSQGQSVDIYRQQ